MMTNKLTKIFKSWGTIVFSLSMAAFSAFGIAWTFKKIDERDDARARTIMLADDRTDTKSAKSPHVNWRYLLENDFPQWLKVHKPNLYQLVDGHKLKFKYEHTFESQNKFSDAFQQGKPGLKLMPNMIMAYGDRFFNTYRRFKELNFPISTDENLGNNIDRKNAISSFVKGATNIFDNKLFMLPVGSSFSNYMYVNKGLLAEMLIILGKDRLAFGSDADKSYLFKRTSPKDEYDHNKSNIPQSEKEVKEIQEKYHKANLKGYVWEFKDKNEFRDQIVLSKRSDQYYFDKKVGVLPSNYRTFLTHTYIKETKNAKNKLVVKEKQGMIPWGQMTDEYKNAAGIYDELNKIKTFDQLKKYFDDPSKYVFINKLLIETFKFQRDFVKKWKEKWTFSEDKNGFITKDENELILFNDNLRLEAEANKISKNIKHKTNADWFTSYYEEAQKKMEKDSNDFEHKPFFGLGNDNPEKSIYMQYSDMEEPRGNKDFLFDENKEKFKFNLKGNSKDRISRFTSFLDENKKLNIYPKSEENGWRPRWGTVNFRNFQGDSRAYNSAYFSNGRMLSILATSGGLWALFDDHTKDFNMIWMKHEMVKEGNAPKVSSSGPNLGIFKHDTTALNAKWNKLNDYKNEISMEFGKYATSPVVNRHIAFRTGYFPIYSSSFEYDKVLENYDELINSVEYKELEAAMKKDNPKSRIYNTFQKVNQQNESNALKLFHLLNSIPAKSDQPAFTELMRQQKNKNNEYDLSKIVWNVPISSLGDELKNVFNYLTNDYWADALYINGQIRRKDSNHYETKDFIESFKEKMKILKKGYDFDIDVDTD
ncbi:MAG: hypothetical protein E7Y34_00440 [Mycoplasma sp.]|nr:hypothetical protein [Mycoplasma sp.]